MHCRRAFTLLEMLISTVLISLVLIGLYQSLNIQQQSNKILHGYLKNAEHQNRNVLVLYRDLIASDGNLSIHKGEFDRLCINRTANTLHDLDWPRVCWVVAKEHHTLFRIEGNAFSLPPRADERVAIDEVMKEMQLFDVYRNKGDLLIVLQAQNKPPYSFVIQGVEAPPPKRKKKKETKK